MKREKKGELKRETDPAKKRAIKEEIDDLEQDREREDARNHASVAEAAEQKKQNIRQRRPSPLRPACLERACSSPRPMEGVLFRYTATSD